MLTFSNHFVQNVFLLQSLPSHSLFLRFASFFVELYIARLESKDWVLGVQFNPIQSSHTGNKWPRPLFHQNLYSTLNWSFQHIHSYWQNAIAWLMLFLIHKIGWYRRAYFVICVVGEVFSTPRTDVNQKLWIPVYKSSFVISPTYIKDYSFSHH